MKNKPTALASTLPPPLPARTKRHEGHSTLQSQEVDPRPLNPAGTQPRHSPQVQPCLRGPLHRASVAPEWLCQACHRLVWALRVGYCGWPPAMQALPCLLRAVFGYCKSRVPPFVRIGAEFVVSESAAADCSLCNPPTPPPPPGTSLTSVDCSARFAVRGLSMRLVHRSLKRQRNCVIETEPETATCKSITSSTAPPLNSHCGVPFCAVQGCRTQRARARLYILGPLSRAAASGAQRCVLPTDVEERGLPLVMPGSQQQEAHDHMTDVECDFSVLCHAVAACLCSAWEAPRPLRGGHAKGAYRALCEKLAVLHHREFGKFRRLKGGH